MHSDADRLAMIMSLGGICVHTDAGPFHAIFRNDFIEQGTELSVESTAPALECRASDVQRLDLKKDTVLRKGEEAYRVKRFEPSDDGWQIVVLKR